MPLGLKRVDTGALIKEYEDREKETDQAIQTSVGEVISEDPRFIEKDAPLLRDEFPPGSKVFFLGEHAYGVAAQVSETASSTLSVVLAVSCTKTPNIFLTSGSLVPSSSPQRLPSTKSLLLL
jgi:hypothetical protein